LAAVKDVAAASIVKVYFMVGYFTERLGSQRRDEIFNNSLHERETAMEVGSRRCSG
jgi:hypothetical protein